ncbi:MAG: ATP-dependent zinc metalloprotease FtsH [Ardenticatenales bacterium]|nr:ATP-dependent zinc metalloprotease FtsH [Ardenticatenales bacterium]
MSGRWMRNSLVFFVFLIVVVSLWRFVDDSSPEEPMSLNDLVQQINAGQIEKIEVDGDILIVERKNGSEAVTRKGTEQGVVETLRALGATPEALQNVEMPINRPSQWGNILSLLSGFLPLLLFGGLIFIMLRQAQGSNNQAMNFGKSRARMFSGDKPTVTFDDVAGAEEAKQELAEIVEFLKEPEKFVALGARIPKGVLMVGPPGTGKTLMARAVAGEAGTPFFSISGSEFVEMFVGVGASRVRDLFEQAKRNAPCIIFIDEIDAVGRQRGAGLGGSHDEREQTLNQILVEMDGFDSETNIIIVAATNRPDILDPALLRPGRFDRRVTLDRPDVKGRRAILDVHIRGKPLAKDVDLDAVARGTPGMAGADLENLVNEAAILAARRNKKALGGAELQEAIERLMMGPERRSRIMSEDERQLTAYHEAGHAVTMYFSEMADPVHKVTIIPRGQAGGYVLWLPDEDRTLESYDRMKDQLVGALGGRAAEEIIWGDVSTGASSDLQRVTQIARAMVTRYGMSKRLGPLTYGDREEMIFLGREISEQRNYSEKIAKQIDEEVKQLVVGAYECALGLLRANRDKLELLAQRLLEVETVDRSDFERLMSSAAPEVEELSFG